jgi:hypothetical protein
VISRPLFLAAAIACSAGLYGAPILTTFTSCTAGATTVTDPTHCEIPSAGVFANAGWTEPPFQTENVARFKFKLDAFAGLPYGPAEAKGDVIVTLYTSGNGQAGFLSIGLLASAFSVFDVGKCSITVSTETSSNTASCNQPPTPVSVTGIPIKLGLGLDPIVISMTGDIVSPNAFHLNGLHSAYMEAGVGIIQSDGKPAAWAPDSGQLASVGLAILGGVYAIRRRMNR